MMKPSAFLVVLMLVALGAHAQYIPTPTEEDGGKYYKQAMQKMVEAKYLEAIPLFDTSIALKGDEFVSWLNRGVAKSFLRRYEEAIIDYNMALQLNPYSKKAHLDRGIALKYITQYNAAIADFDTAIVIDHVYAEAYFHRAAIHELFSRRDSACKDYQLAYAFGLAEAHKKNQRCNDTAASSVAIHPIPYIKQIATDADYGYISTKPIKVGVGPDGGPANQRQFLELLRDANGKPLTYKRLRSCCPYPSPNGFMGMANIDEYEVTFTDATGASKTVSLFFSFYDYEEPLVPVGFNRVVGNN